MIGENDQVISTGYKLFAGDVRDADILKEKLQKAGVSQSIPTLILTECLLVYMKQADTQGILEWTRDFFAQGSDIAYLNYEMINPEDRFG